MKQAARSSGRDQTEKVELKQLQQKEQDDATTKAIIIIGSAVYMLRVINRDLNGLAYLRS